jgi:putative membrane protein
MVADHGKANKQLDELARAAKVPQPKDADEQHKAMLQHVDKLNGGNFDLAYIRGQVTDHPQLKAFTAQALPTVLHHLELSAIQAELTASAPERTGSGTSRPEPRTRTLAR